VTLASWKCLQSGTKVQFVWKFSGGGDYIGPRGVFVAHGQTYLHTTTDTITPGEFINGGLSWYAIHPVTNVTIGHGLAIADAAAGKTCS
jgi:hypothetical protein